jgi:hypothetical protein
MATWHKKACALFGFKPGSYSFARGKVEIADLASKAKEAVAAGDDDLLGRILEYATWAAIQQSDQLASAVDLGFFLPVFRDRAMRDEIACHIPAELFAAKWRALMEEPAVPGAPPGE